jgi:integrase
MIKKQWSDRFGREVWGYDARIGKRRRQKFGFSSESAAKIALAKARVAAFDREHGVAPPEPKPAVTVRQLVERRKSQMQGSKSQRKSARLLERWLDTLPPGLLVTELTTAVLQEWIDLRAGKVSHETVFREMTDICSCIGRAPEIFSALKDWRPPRRPRMRVPTLRRERVITREEAARLLAWLRRPKGRQYWRDGRGVEWADYVRFRHDAADLLQIALLTAARRGEILSLRWSDVDFERQALRITGTKTERVRIIPMAAPLVSLLKRRRESRGGPLVFPVGRMTLLMSTSKVFRAAGRAVGVPYGRDVPGGWILHDARHTAITAMLDAGYSLESVRQISGHSARVIAMRYAHASDASVRAAVSALDQFGGEISATISAALLTAEAPLTPMSPTAER